MNENTRPIDMTEASERMAAVRKRKAAEGMIRKEVWIHKDKEKAFLKMVKKLKESK